MEHVQSFVNRELINEDFSTFKSPNIRDDFIAKLENALMYLSFRQLNMWHSECINPVSLKQFDGSWCVDISLRHDEGDPLTYTPYGDLQVTPDMFPNLNIKLMTLSGDIVNLMKYRFLSQKEKRNLISSKFIYSKNFRLIKQYKYMFSEKFGFLDYGKQRWWTCENGYGFNNFIQTDDKVLVSPIPASIRPGYILDPNMVKAAMVHPDEDSPYKLTVKNFHMALQLALAYYYEWSCYIRETPDSLGIRIPIHPSSSKEIFMMRNIPEGKQRRTAIINYVKEHYRKITDFNEKERLILIKKHFRGDLKFKWRGLEVHVTPSQYDLNRIKTKKKFEITELLENN